MTDHGRKRGDKPSYPICVWNGIFDHYEKIGIALWEFLWLIDAITEEQDGIGWVYSKAPLKIERIATDLGIGNSTVRRNLDRLKDGGYIVTQKARYGLIIGVVNSRKIRPRTSNPDRSDMSVQESRPLESEHSDRSKVSGLSAKSERTGDSILNDNAVRQSNKTASGLPLASFWQEMGIDPNRLSGGIRKLCEDLHAAKGNQSPVEFLSACMDAIQAMDWSIPPQNAQAKAELKVNGNGHHQRAPMRELEAEPWGAGSGVRQ